MNKLILLFVGGLVTFAAFSYINRPVDITENETTSRGILKAARCRRYRRMAKSENLLVSGASVITMKAGDDSLIPDGAVLICDGLIRFVGTNAAYSASNTRCTTSPNHIRLRDSDVIVPAFINTHTHSAMSLLKNLGNDRDLNTWLNTFIFPLENSLANEDFCRTGSKLAMAEFLASGTSTFADMYFHQDAVAEEVDQVGMRAFLGESIIDYPQNDSPTPENTLVIGEAFIQRWTSHPRISPLMAPHAPYTTSASVYQRAVALNRKYGARTLTHCSETKGENAGMRAHQNLPAGSTTTSTQWLHDIGVLGPDLTCAHSVWLTDEDIKLYGQTGTKVGHCPSSNLKLASGFMPYSRLKAAGITIGIGTDGHSSNNDVDIVEESRMASLIHKGVDLNPLTLPALDALRLLTMGGAKALGVENEQGSLEVGKQGDLAIFGGKSVKWTPRFDIHNNGTLKAADTAALITYDSNAYDVRGTVVAGKVLYFDSCYTTLDMLSMLESVEYHGGRIRNYFVETAAATRAAAATAAAAAAAATTAAVAAVAAAAATAGS